MQKKVFFLPYVKFVYYNDDRNVLLASSVFDKKEFDPEHLYYDEWTLFD